MTNEAHETTPEHFDLQPILWRVLVEPLKPDKKVGLIELSDDTQNAQRYNTCVGKVLSLGSQAYTAVTKAGMDLKAEPYKPKPDDYVVFGQNAGQKIHTKGGAYYVLLNDTEILAVTTTPETFKRYV